MLFNHAPVDRALLFRCTPPLSSTLLAAAGTCRPLKALAFSQSQARDASLHSVDLCKGDQSSNTVTRGLRARLRYSRKMSEKTAAACGKSSSRTTAGRRKATAAASTNGAQTLRKWRGVLETVAPECVPASKCLGHSAAGSHITGISEVLCGLRGLEPAFDAREADEFTLAIVGDLHLEKKGTSTFERAREQLLDVLESGDGAPRVVQLGDLGGYNEKPGESTCLSVYSKAVSTILTTSITEVHCIILSSLSHCDICLKQHLYCCRVNGVLQKGS